MGAGLSGIRTYFLKWKTDENSKKCLNDENTKAQSIDETKANGSNKIPTEHVSSEINNNFHATIKTCNNKDEFFEYFDTTDSFADDVSNLMLKFEFVDILPELNLTDLQDISKKFHGKSKVLLLMSENEQRISIYWKSKKIDEFLELKHTKKLDWESSRSLSEYIAEFLVNSLTNDHLGLISKFSFKPGSKPIDIDLLADSRDFNLLLLSVENGNTHIVEILLKLGVNTFSMDNKVDAQSLAIECSHFDVIYALLQNNLTFPKTFDVSECTGKLKEFCEITEEVHWMIIANDKDKLKKILNQQKNIRHFYNFLNESALRVAIESKSFDAFDLLLSHNLRFGSNENPAEYYEQMDTNSKRTLRDIQHKYSQPFLDKHIHTLLSKSTACFDETEAKDKLGHVQRAFELLSENPFIKIILKIVAASKNIEIVFDFNREAVNVVDPTTSEFTQGICYFFGKIYIGAKQLLDSETVNETLAVLAHELCHYAMILVYKNQAKPYKIQDKKTMKKFEKISKDCQAESRAEEIIGSVFDDYCKDAHHLELIVRVVHLLALYRDMPEKLTEVRGIFIKLFEFYENKTVPELERALLELERAERDGEEIKTKDKMDIDLSNFLLICVILIVAYIGTTFLLVCYPTKYLTISRRFIELTDNERMLVFEAPIRYKGMDLKFQDLFPKNSTVYKNLTSEHIIQIFNKNVLDFSDPHLHYLEEQVTLKWENLTQKLKQKFLASNFTFQNESLKFKNLHEINPEVFNSLSSEQIVEVLVGKELGVHEMVKSETKFYVDRNFWDENIQEIYFDFMKFVSGDSTCPSYNNTKSNKTFESFYLDFIRQNISTQLKKINDIRQNSKYKVCPLSDFKIKEPKGPYKVSDTLLSHRFLQFNFDQVINIAKYSKLFILSAEAGTGKTVTFEQFTMRIKKEFPTRWVSYIDLKDYKHLYKGIRTLQDVRNMLEIIFKLSSKNEFEKKIFEDFFDSGNLILLWNGFDEISPGLSEDVIRILQLIRNGTGNIQFVCTRPLYSDQLNLNFLTQIYTLIPFDYQEQENFVTKFFIAENLEQSKIPNYLEKVQKIVKSTHSKEPFDTPLMLGMIVEMIANDIKIYESENLFEIYQKFVEKKIEIWRNKCEFGRNFLGYSAIKYRRFDMMKLYQSYAIKILLQHNVTAYSDSQKLKIMSQKVPKELTNDEISRMGILYINGPNFKFVHRTFIEFFFVQFLIENIYNADDNPLYEEAELRISTFNVALQNIKIEKFIKYLFNPKHSVELKPFEPHISNALTTKYQKIFFESHESLVLIDFFKKDINVLKILLQIDEKQTFFTANYASLAGKPAIDPHVLKNAVRPYLNANEFERFLRGIDQKGVILFSSYVKRSYRSDWIHDSYKLDEKLMSNNDPFYVLESIAKILTKDELKQLLTSEIIFSNPRSLNEVSYKAYQEKVSNFIKDQITELAIKGIFDELIATLFGAVVFALFI